MISARRIGELAARNPWRGCTLISRRLVPPCPPAPRAGRRGKGSQEAPSGPAGLLLLPSDWTARENRIEKRPGTVRAVRGEVGSITLSDRAESPRVATRTASLAPRGLQRQGSAEVRPGGDQVVHRVVSRQATRVMLQLRGASGKHVHLCRAEQCPLRSKFPALSLASLPPLWFLFRQCRRGD